MPKSNRLRVYDSADDTILLQGNSGRREPSARAAFNTPSRIQLMNNEREKTLLFPFSSSRNVSPENYLFVAIIVVSRPFTSSSCYLTFPKAYKQCKTNFQLSLKTAKHTLTTSFIEQVCSTSTKVNNLRTPVTILF